MTPSAPPNPSATLTAHFVSAMASEIRGQLAYVKGADTTMLNYRNRLPDLKINSFLSTIDTVTDHLTVMLDILIDLARIQVGILRIDPKMAPLKEVIRLAVPSCSVEGPEVELPLDRVRFKQAWSLLLAEVPDCQIQVKIDAETSCVIVRVQAAGAPLWLENARKIINQPELVSRPDFRRVVLPALRQVVSVLLFEAHGAYLSPDDQLGAPDALNVTFQISPVSSEDE